MLDYAAQPYQGTDVVAIVFAIAALSCLHIRLRDKEPGMGWFALSMGSLAAWMAANAHHLPDGPELNPTPWYFAACLAMGAMGPGLAAYLGLPPNRRRLATLAVVLPSAAFAVMVVWVMVSGAVVPRIWLHAFTALAWTSMAVMVLWAAPGEPGAGYTVLGVALLSVPALALLLLATGADPVALRYWGVLPAMLVGLGLPTVSMMRRRQALQAEVRGRRSAEAQLAALNRSLEQQVAQRTGDLEQMVTALESFNRNVSHDLRGPLGGIAGLAQLAAQALEQGDTGVVAQALPAIARQAENSGRLVDSLLELARVGEVTLQLQPVDTAAVTREVVEQMRLTMPGPLPKIVMHALPEFETDPSLLRAILANLIGNAVKFTGGGGQGRVEVGARKRDHGVCLYVADNGVGFDAETASTIFKPFSRLHGKAYAGHGIGLSIVRRAVDRLGGEVRAESAPGMGASFEVSLPARR